MFADLMALVGALATGVAPAPAGGPPAVVDMLEVSFSTHVGEGAAGRKRFRRDGCYQVESGGGTGGAGHARDSQAGCHRPADVAATFTRVAALAAGNAVVRDSGEPRGAAGGARAEPEGGPGGSQTRVVLVRPDGSRWVAASAKIAQELVAAANQLPSENQWYAEPPAPPLGTGPQLLVLSATAPDRRLEASLASDGRWWCHLSVTGLRGSEHKLPPPGKLALTDAPARLARILAGARPPGKVADEAPADKQPFEASIEVVWPGQPRAALRPRAQGRPVAQRFATEMGALSPACALAPSRSR
jgi:hypothetical protein